MRFQRLWQHLLFLLIYMAILPWSNEAVGYVTSWIHGVFGHISFPLNKAHHAAGWGFSVTTKPTPDTVHSPTPGQLHVESIQLACTCALCCCYALCMKREELLIFYSFWLRCFVVMMQYVGFLGRSELFGSQVKVGAPTWQLARANSGFGARQVPHSSSSFAPFMHSLSLLGISRYHASKATQEGQGEEGDSHRPHVCPSPSPRCTT